MNPTRKQIERASQALGEDPASWTLDYKDGLVLQYAAKQLLLLQDEYTAKKASWKLENDMLAKAFHDDAHERGEMKCKIDDLTLENHVLCETRAILEYDNSKLRKALEKCYATLHDKSSQVGLIAQQALSTTPSTSAMETIKKMVEALDLSLTDIRSSYVDWAKISPASPDYDPAYKPTYPEIVDQLKEALDAAKKEGWV